MKIPEKLSIRLDKIGIDQSIYENRIKKCILSREKLGLEKVPWFNEAYFIDESFDKEKYFVFDPISLVPCLVLDPKENDKILDICAAPGTKTFILSYLANNKAKLIANDIDRHRVLRLKNNISRFNINAEISNISGRKIEGSFNKILLDAPCSSQGIVNKKEKLFRNWSEKKVRALPKKQKKLIEHAFELLENKGTLIYSTCTFEPDENEAVVDFLLSKHENAKIENIEIKNLKHEKGFLEWNGKKFFKEMEKCLRIYPQHNNTGGFFVAKISKRLLS